MESAVPLSPLEKILERDRLIILAGAVLIAALAWADLAYDAWAMGHMDIVEMAMPSLGHWGIYDLYLIFVMWTVMMVAMMVPSVTPMLLLFAQVNRKRRAQSRPFVPTSFFLAGYLAVWTGFSLVATLAQWGLHEAAWISPAMVGTNRILGGLLLIGAGVFQFTPYKQTCLAQCRNPLAFILTEWREGTGGAWTMGLRHGLFCLGCCWLLMLLLFVTGVMNLFWVALISVLVLAEKVFPWGHRLGQVVGIGFALWGGYLILGNFFSNF